jgi:RNA polymerase primary sigma factor
MYLTELRKTRLLTRAEELALSEQMETSRRRFRRSLLEFGHILAAAVARLQRVQRGEAAFDRTVQVAVSDRLEKPQVLGRLPHNLGTLEAILVANRAEYVTATRRSLGKGGRRAAWRKLVARRHGEAHLYPTDKVILDRNTGEVVTI